MIDAGRWFDCLIHCNVLAATALKWAPSFEQHCQADRFSKGFEEMVQFVGQILHESGGLKSLEENLDYSTPERLMVVWPSRFPTRESALSCVHNPVNLASHVYGLRKDLGNLSPGDGWNYRGSGLIQCTGKANYETVKRATGIDVVSYPEKMREPESALLIAIAWWEGRVPDTALGNVKAVTKAVNGASVGLAERDRLTNLVKDYFHGQAITG